MRRRLIPILFLVLLSLSGNVWANFTGTNQPSQDSDFSFEVSADVTSVTLTVSGDGEAWSHLLLKKGSPPTNDLYDFSSQYDGQDNSIQVELPEISEGTWYLRVRTPAASGVHSFNVQIVTQTASIQPQNFQSSGELSSGEWDYYRVEIPENSPGWRMVLNSSGTTAASLYVQKEQLPNTGSYLKQVSYETNATLILTELEATAGVYYVGVYQPYESSSYQLHSEVGYLTTLQWDPGTTHLGTEVFTNSSQTGGCYYFNISPQDTATGAWRTALNVLSGEAEVYLLQGSLPTNYYYHYISDQVGSDGFVVHPAYYSPGQEWFIMVKATPGSQWNLVTGEVYVQDLGQLTADASSSSGEVIMGAEGMRFFKTTTPVDTHAWRLWLNGALNNIYVKKGTVPLPNDYDLAQAQQMLVVPSYLDGTGIEYFVTVADTPGTTINLDSRQQPILDLDFGDFDTQTITGFGYVTYRVQVPVEQIAWQVKLSQPEGNASVAVRRDYVPNEWNNNAFSEVDGVADESITLVPPTLSDGTFFITVYGNQPYTFTLENGNPVITDIPFVSTTLNDDPDRAGWRYYRVTDISSQLGCLGWELLLDDQVPGTEIALRRNAVPSRWNYRENGGTYEHFGHVDYSGIGFLQRPGHQADFWYVGIYSQMAALGSFELTAQLMNAEQMGFDGVTVDVTDQPAGKWRYFKMDVPANTVGWDLRLINVTSGSPQLRVSRDRLPSSEGGNQWPWPYTPSACTEWPSGCQWNAESDWTNRYYDSTGFIYENNRILAMGMGNPLEPGTYYVGVGNSWDSTPMSYTLLSRGIGDGMTIPIVDVAFDGGSVTAEDVAPREAAYYRVTIPEDTPSWQARLTPTTGEALMQILYQKIPNINSHELFFVGGQKMQKNGKEQWALLPNSGEEFIAAGTYYVAVVSEGQNPLDWPYIGTGESSWTFESQGVMEINNLGTVGATDLVHADSLEGGAAKAYQFTVLEGTTSIEVRLQNQVGIPMLKLVQGEHLPGINQYYGNDYYGNYGGELSASWHSDLITVPNPVPGVYSVIVNASDGSSGAGEDASYTLRVTNGGVATLAFDGGISTIDGQESGAWNFYQVVVPDTAVGWDLRLVNVTSGSPLIVVRRDSLPVSSGSEGWPWPYYPQGCTEWPSGCQWQAGNDWTNRFLDPTGTIVENNRILAMGIGNPLEPGTYFVAVGDYSGYSTPLSYTLLSRGIGDGMTIPIVDVAFDGGSITTENIAPREAVYYRVTIPENTPSWQARLSPTTGEAMMQILWQKIPNVSASNLFDGGGQSMQKVDKEQWVLLPNSGEEFITAGAYYVAVVSEGQDPIIDQYIGTGESSWTFESQGVMEINNLGTVGATDLVQDDSLEGGAAKAYQFTVPEGTSSIEVRLQNQVGIPMLKLVQGERLPSINANGNDYYGNYGGLYNTSWHSDLITVPNPVPGIYSVIVNASDGYSGAGEDASYTLRVTKGGVPQVAFDGGNSAIDGQEPGTWNFFQVEVPANTVGWDIRLVNVTSGMPQLIVRRDILPDPNSGSIGWSWPYAPSEHITWPSGCQWYAGNDWTNRYLDPTGTIVEQSRILAMGMGNPLEPGTYYVAVGNSSHPTPMSYTILSRGIGEGMTIPIIDVPFDGGMASAENIAPREAVYYRVTIPENTPSWQARLSPTIGEAMMQVQKQKLPNIQAGWANPYEYGGKQIQKTDKEQWVLLPNNEEEFIPAGTYYAAVISEGQDPVDWQYIGTGESSWTFESQGVMEINNLGTLGVIDLIQADSLEGGAAKAYQFTVPEGTLSIEVRLQNRVGMPMLKLVQGDRLPCITTDGYTDYYGNYGGQNVTHWHSDLVTVPNPVPGVYSLIVNASDGSYGTGQNASYTLHIRKHVIPDLNFTESMNTNGLSNIASGELADQQSAFYKVTVPEEVDGGPINGWRLKLSTTQGEASVRVRQDILPNLDYYTMPYRVGDALITPPYLTAGTWYVEVKGAGNTNYTLTSLNFETERPAWEMPLMGNPVTTPGLEGTSYFGDSGVEQDGTPLPGDQGIDLENGSYHYYAVTVPEDNAVLIRTMLEAISGNPDLYIRTTLPPTNDHSETGTPGSLYDRILYGTGTEYGNWVPIDGKIESYLQGGTWYFAVRAASDTNCRYRLKISAGDVQDLTLSGGSYSDQILAAKDWRYYKVSVPTDAPANWNVTFNQQSGDVIMHVRDTSPPGNTTYGDSFADWGSEYTYYDRKNDGPYSSYDSPGTHTFGVQPLRPGHTYYLGFRAITDAVFSVNSTTSGGVFANPIVVPYYAGSQNIVINPNSSAVFRFDVPEDAGNWQLYNTHSSDISVYMEQGSMPYLDYSADWQSNGYENSSFSFNLVPSSWPWLPGHSYYMVAVNNSAFEQAFGTSSVGQGYPADLVVTLTDAPDPVQVGENITYTMTVSNNIDRPAANVVLTNTLPANVSFVSATSTIGTCTGTDTVVCNIGTLPQSQTATVTIVVTAISTGTFDDTATVVSDTPELNSYDNTAYASTIIVPSSPTYSGGSGAIDDPYLIATAEDLYCVRYNLDKYFLQIADVYLYYPWDFDSGWQPIGYYNSISDNAPFTGSYDGGNYGIRYLYIQRPTTDCVGLFGYTNGAKLANITLSQSRVWGRDYVGSLVGWQNGGSITRCYINEGYCSTDGRNFVGGLVGYNDSGDISKSFNIGYVQGSSYLGGLVGCNLSANVNNSYSTAYTYASTSYTGGLVGYNSSSTITDCYSYGYVYSDGGYSGGLVGYNTGGTVNGSYWDIDYSGHLTSAGGVGKTSEQMRKQATFGNWDFDNIWDIQEDSTYPYFRAEVSYDLVNISDAKKSIEDRPIEIEAAIVSAAWENSFYITTDNGTTGIRVMKYGHGMSDYNTRVTVKGVVKTNPHGERYILASSVVYAGDGSVKPVGMPMRSLGGGSAVDGITGFGQQGVLGANGVNNIGLLVRVWGRIVEVESATAPDMPSWFKIDDGSGRIVRCMVEDESPAIDSLWQDRFVVVTGISSCEFEDGNLVSMIRLKKNTDPTLY